MDEPTWLDLERAEKWALAMREPLRLPERFVAAEPGKIPHQPQVAVIKRYFKEFEKLAAEGKAPSFFGRAETYKTYCAAVVARWVEGKAGLETMWVDAGSEFLRLENDRFSTETARRLQRLSTVAFLVLDDITNVMPKSQALQMMTMVACERFARLRPTIYTGNFLLGEDTWPKFAELYSPALARRVARGAAGFLCVTR